MNLSRILNRLADAGLVDAAQAEEIAAALGREHVSLDALMPALPDGDEARVDAIVAEELELPFRDDLSHAQADALFLERVSPGFAKRAGIIGLARRGTVMEVATRLPPNLNVLDELGFLLDADVQPVIAPRAEIERLIDRVYEGRSQYLVAAVDELREGDLSETVAEIEQISGIADLANKAPVVKLVSLAVAQAVKKRASDVHFQPFGDVMKIRYRVDGMLHDVMDVPRSAQAAVITRIKVLAGMDVAERRRPQDGRTSFRYGDRDVDVRVSVVPTQHGERAVLRLLHKEEQVRPLEEIGLADRSLRQLRELVTAPHGMILATGPVGSGKTTTLYAILGRINSPDKNIITIEDPIEYRLPGVSQIPILPQRGVTFANTLRSVLRQDPNVLMVGEVRDMETATMAVQAALTGHLLLTTLHTSDAPGAVARLLDLGVEPFLLSSTLLATLAQRLVRRVCGHCAQPAVPEPWEIESLGIAPEDAASVEHCRAGRGCEQCMNTGYLDRIGLFELLITDDELRDQVNRREGSAAIRDRAVARGMTTLRMDGARKILAGITTPAEVLRVTQRDVS